LCIIFKLEPSKFSVITWVFNSSNGKKSPFIRKSFYRIKNWRSRKASFCAGISE
jgi:hypothetical protein